MKNKICFICKMTINMDKEEFVEVKYYEKRDKIKSKGYYHLKCFRDRLNNAQGMNRLQREALDFVRKAKKKVGIEDDEEVVTI
jgi:hypothetical protein